MSERIQKLLSRAGFGSRREVDRWLQEGLITVNGELATPGDRANADDQITLRGKPLSFNAVKQFRPRVIMYHKPIGEVVSRRDPQGRPTVFDNIPEMKTSRWVAVGRLDINTVGLLIFTNDGELAHRLMHPSSEIDREYAVRVLGDVSKESIKAMLEGVKVDGYIAKFDDIQKVMGGNEQSANQWYHVVLQEGKKREVRRLWGSQGYKVNRLIRVRYGSLRLERELRPGKWRELSRKELKGIYADVGLPAPVSAVSRREIRPRR